jgi:hypothetical protein
MPTSTVGHADALPNATASPRNGQQDPRAAPQSRRKSTPPATHLVRAARSNRPGYARQLSCRRQIPIDQTGRKNEPKPSAVSSPEACPTPATRGKATLTHHPGRRPTNLHSSGLNAHPPRTSASPPITEVARSNVCFQGNSGPRPAFDLLRFVANSRHSELHKIDWSLAAICRRVGAVHRGHVPKRGVGAVVNRLGVATGESLA